jgi:hypothetical protein
MAGIGGSASARSVTQIKSICTEMRGVGALRAEVRAGATAVIAAILNVNLDIHDRHIWLATACPFCQFSSSSDSAIRN